MERLANTLAKTTLFQGLDPSKIEEMLSTMVYEVKTVQKEDTIFHYGEEIEQFGLVLSGSVRVETIDFDGNISIYSIIAPGYCFGEIYALLQEPLPVLAIANEECVLFFCSIHSIPPALSHNLLLISLKKNKLLSSRIQHLSHKTIEEKVLSYLFSRKRKYGSHFRIPYTREQFAQYLNVDRTALSAVLSKLKKAGKIDYHLNEFWILPPSFEDKT